MLVPALIVAVAWAPAVAGVPRDDVSQLGLAMAVVGDLDGDGVSDLALGDPARHDRRGQVLLVSGVSGDTLRTLIGPREACRFGVTLAGPGDLDGDGVPDVVIGEAGTAHLGDVFGKGLHADHRGHVSAWSGASGAPLWEQVVEVGSYRIPSAGLGADPVLAVLPDVDDDGVAEVAVGSPDAREQAGSVRLLSGARGARLAITHGVEAGRRLGTALVALDDAEGSTRGALVAASCPSAKEGVGRLLTFSLPALDPMGAWPLEPSGRFAGLALARLPDRDGDGRRETLVGMPWAGGGQGHVLLLDGRGEQVLQRWTGRHDGAFGATVVPVGDTDGDGVGDVLIAAPDSFDSEDRALVWLFSGAGDEVLLSWRTGSRSHFGVSAAGPGDLDGDGVPDVVIAGASTRSADTWPGCVEARSGKTGALLWRRGSLGL